MNRDPFVIYSSDPKQGDRAIRMLEPTDRLRMAGVARDTAQVRLKAPPASISKTALLVALLTVVFAAASSFVISRFLGH
jgi:hypothetical protein